MITAHQVTKIPNFTDIQTFLSYLLTTRQLIKRDLVEFLNNYIELNLRSLYQQSCMINSREPLKIFQMSLCRIPILPSVKIDEDYQNFRKFVSPELLTRVEYNVRHLSELFLLIQHVKQHNSFPSKNQKVPNVPIKEFLHRCYIYSGRRLWNQPELVSHKYSRSSLDQNRLKLRELINDAIEDVINDFIKIDDFYQKFRDIVKNTKFSSPKVEENPSVAPIDRIDNNVEERPPSPLSSSDSSSSSSSSSYNQEAINQEAGSQIQIQTLNTQTPEDAIETRTEEPDPVVAEVQLSLCDGKNVTVEPKLESGHESGSSPKLESGHESGSSPKLGSGHESGHESGSKSGSQLDSVPVGLKNPISKAQINIPAQHKLDFNYLSPQTSNQDKAPSNQKKIIIGPILKSKSQPKSILKIRSPTKKNRKIRFIMPTQKIRIRPLSPPKEQATPKVKPKLAPDIPTESTISTIKLPVLKLLNSSELISNISSNSSDSFQLNTPAVKVEASSAEKEAKGDESGPLSKSNIFSFSEVTPEVKPKPTDPNDEILEVTIDEGLLGGKHLPKPESKKQTVNRGKPNVSRKNQVMVECLGRTPSPSSRSSPYFDSRLSPVSSDPETPYSSEDLENSSFDLFIPDNASINTSITRLNKFMNLDMSPRDLLKFGRTRETRSLTGEKIKEFSDQYDRLKHRP